MSFLELAKKRFSVRKYSNRVVEKEVVESILEAGRLAPTAANFQPVKVFVVQSKEKLDAIEKAVNIFGAPVALVVCADHNKAWVRPFDDKQTTDIDATIVTDHMMMQATDLGLGSLWVCKFKSEIISDELNIPSNFEPVNILAIGYAGDVSAPVKKRNALESFAVFE